MSSKRQNRPVRALPARLGLLLVGALVLGASATAGISCTPTPALDHILFAHGPHLARGSSCTDCHGGGADHEADLMPSEESCRSCHDDPARDRCGYCHSEPSAPRGYERPVASIRFDHAGHEAPRQGECVQCHNGERRALAVFEPQSPVMSNCTDGCHAEEMRGMECLACHRDLGRYRLGDLVTIGHPPGFGRDHATAARTDNALCAQCHEPNFCGDCHTASPGLPLEVLEATRVYRELVHRGDFQSRHAIEADLERGTCTRCHGTSFCDDCHRLSGVGGGVAAGSPHPPGWLDPASPFGHARSARRDLLSCVACHESDAESRCVPCHRVGGVAASPHPPGFGGGQDPLAHGVCRACHVR